MSQRPVLPPATIGMLGGGQLGRYALMAAKTMGYRTMVLDPDPSAPAGAVADEHLVAAYDDAHALQRLILDCEVVTTEFENPPADALDTLAGAVAVAPRPDAVRIAQDRIAEKRFLVDNGFPIGAYAILDGTDGAAPGNEIAVEGKLAALVEGGAIIKTARLGYDGKGQRRVGTIAELHAAWAELDGVPCVVESLLDLQTEVSVIVARTPSGDVRTWAVAENTHVDGILDVSVVPAAVPTELSDRAEGIAMAIADALDYVGTLAVEMFVVRADTVGEESVAGISGCGESDVGAARLLVNELAPRPHNSGHWTLDGSVTSQYEQQIRSICGLDLGSTDMLSPAVAMVNLLGDLWEPDTPEWATALADPRAKLHLYGKHEARPGRKMGHLTVLGTNTNEAAARAVALRHAL